MPLSIIVDAETGRQKRLSATETLDAQDGETALLISSLDAEPDPDTYRWNPEARVYEPIPGTDAAPISRTKLTKREFRARLGQACRVQINARILTPPTTPEEVTLVASLQDMKDELLSADFVDVEHPTTIAAVQALVALDYLTGPQGTAALAPSTVLSE